MYDAFILLSVSGFNTVSSLCKSKTRCAYENTLCSRKRQKPIKPLRTVSRLAAFASCIHTMLP